MGKQLPISHTIDQRRFPTFSDSQTTLSTFSDSWTTALLFPEKFVNFHPKKICMTFFWLFLSFQWEFLLFPSFSSCNLVLFCRFTCEI